MYESDLYLRCRVGRDLRVLGASKLTEILAKCVANYVPRASGIFLYLTARDAEGPLRELAPLLVATAGLLTRRSAWFRVKRLGNFPRVNYITHLTTSCSSPSASTEGWTLFARQFEVLRSVYF